MRKGEVNRKKLTKQNDCSTIARQVAISRSRKNQQA